MTESFFSNLPQPAATNSVFQNLDSAASVEEISGYTTGLPSAGYNMTNLPNSAADIESRAHNIRVDKPDQLFQIVKESAKNTEHLANIPFCDS